MDALNPKDRVGQAKPRLSVLSMPVLYEVGNAVNEGARKYGAFNVRVVPVRASIYFDATMRHLAAWWEGQDTDPDSGLHHVTKAIASLMVLRDAMIHGKVRDDRPPKTDEKWISEAAERCAEVISRYPEPKAPFTESNLED
jgi:hypothetical protein